MPARPATAPKDTARSGPRSNRADLVVFTITLCRMRNVLRQSPPARSRPSKSSPSSGRRGSRTVPATSPTGTGTGWSGRPPLGSRNGGSGLSRKPIRVCDRPNGPKQQPRVFSIPRIWLKDPFASAQGTGCLQCAECSSCGFAELVAVGRLAPALIGDLQGERAKLRGHARGQVGNAAPLERVGH